MRWLLIVAFLLVTPAVGLAEEAATPDARVHDPPAEFIPAVPGEGKLLNRLMAPCCWKGTLEGHHSPMVEELKQEVRRRLLAGEKPETIEADFIQRYGDQVRAVPAGWDLESAFGWYAGGLLLSGFAMFLVGRRWLRRRAEVVTPVAVAAPAASEKAQLEDKLDDELADLQ